MNDVASAPLLADRVERPKGTPDRLAEQIGFLLEADQLKTIVRRSHLMAADRRENDAEHSWHLALMVVILAEYADEPIDIGHTIALVTIHELVEIYAGDTFLYDAEAVADQAEREQAAAVRLFGLLPADQAGRLRALWDEFEEGRSPEARFARAMDRLEPLLLNANTKGATWAQGKVTADMVRGRKRRICRASTVLGDYAGALIEHAVEQGWLPDDRLGQPCPPPA